MPCVIKRRIKGFKGLEHQGCFGVALIGPDPRFQSLTEINSLASAGRQIVEAEAIAPLAHGSDSTAFAKTGLL